MFFSVHGKNSSRVKRFRTLLKVETVMFWLRQAFLISFPFFSLVVLFQRQLFPSMTSQAGAWLLVERILTVQLKNIQLKELTIFIS